MKAAQVSDVVVDEGALGVHQVEFVVDAGEDFGDGGAVGDPNLRSRAAVEQKLARKGFIV